MILVQLISYKPCPHLYLTTYHAKVFPPSLYFVHFVSKQLFSVPLCIADIEHVLKFIMLDLLTISHSSGHSLCAVQTERERER